MRRYGMLLDDTVRPLQLVERDNRADPGKFEHMFCKGEWIGESLKVF